MKLNEYFELECISASAFAKRIKAHAPDVVRWANGQRSTPVIWCVRIENATDGKVSRRDLRPDDYFQIWPELAEECGASPKLPEI